ncbi:MAG: mycothiol-dependent nitroreductase Rv2466c family protein [Gulosibacter sp.]|uniref:mycothiol-dependent nitroreductase Rv2466c family protein n=1 Tax=Gulosibacter sp. TaxID=2817531 RepID=UPI003F9088B9
MSENTPTKVDFWFDPACPWAWMTSRWIDEVASLRDSVEVEWHIMSLAILNENREMDDAHRASHQRSMRAGKVAAGIIAELGNDKVKAFYDEIGTRIHPEGRGKDDGILEESMAAAGIDEAILSRADAGEFDAQLRASHEDGIGRVGQDVGTPIVSVNGVAFFGPVISPAPKGDMALTLFDGVVAAASYEGFFELKRSRTRGPEFN